ncbi:WXG100 family type VII secretion target [Mycobacterium deserti]|uniref:ESAT-6-like protein n=1 Tax=Mycobacterium deserti TaxID=2978347 RepID=A0ABT2M8R3_9MYCO|nr:WXG100 family type VII secretion target [Mycobacterium deserti]MCT7658647.1 WXG100 family type VII secretion target [Mycobacterium deserti]
MTDGGIRVNFAAVAGAATDLTAQANQIEGLLNDERGILTTLGGAWNGAAKEAWQANQQRWQVQADELNMILDRLATTLTEVAGDFEKNENANKQRWQ